MVFGRVDILEGARSRVTAWAHNKDSAVSSRASINIGISIKHRQLNQCAEVDLRGYELKVYPRVLRVVWGEGDSFYSRTCQNCPIWRNM